MHRGDKISGGGGDDDESEEAAAAAEWSVASMIHTRTNEMNDKHVWVVGLDRKGREGEEKETCLQLLGGLPDEFGAVAQPWR